MKNYKTLSLLSIFGTALFVLSFIYNIIFALATGSAPCIPYEATFMFLPIIIGMFLVPYGLKNNNRMLIYLGNIISASAALLMVVSINDLVLGPLSVASIAFLVALIWPFVLLIGSLSLMAFYKKADFRPIHNIVTLVALGGVGLGILFSLIIPIIFAIQFSSFLIFVSFLPVFFATVGLIPIAAMAFFLKDEARIVKLQVPEWKKAEKPAPAAAPEVKPAPEVNLSVKKKKIEAEEKDLVADSVATDSEEKPQA